jgi:L-threonylcarbamoyladenylate synthase
MGVSTALLDISTVSVAAGIIQRGGLVVFPTETVYGLGADGLNPDAVKRIFTAKGRPQDNPLILHVADTAALEMVARDVPDMAQCLLEAFSPGPFTVVLARAKSVSPVVSGGLDTVAVRIPSHPVAQLLIRAAGTPIAAPSANLSGRPSPTTYRMALKEMQGRVEAIIDGGDADLGLESTVVRVKNGCLEILRPGAVTREMIESVLNDAGFRDMLDDRRGSDPASDGAGSGHKPELEPGLGSPGMRYSHYKPEAVVYCTESSDLRHIMRRFPGSRVGVLMYAPGSSRQSMSDTLETPRPADVSDEPAPGVSAPDTVRVIPDCITYAKRLYRELVRFDSVRCDVVIAVLPPAGGLGDAIRDRLIRASGGRRI